MGDSVNNENVVESSSALISLSSFLCRDGVFGIKWKKLWPMLLHAR